MIYKDPFKVAADTRVLTPDILPFSEILFWSDTILTPYVNLKSRKISGTVFLLTWRPPFLSLVRLLMTLSTPAWSPSPR
uniref:Uncharacterized protein n=1 Tax=Hyaloperonospora arabidopsidis (strain Emoy2) TaxID=559515 RepID=M4B4I9_HYAAE